MPKKKLSEAEKNANELLRLLKRDKKDIEASQKLALEIKELMERSQKTLENYEKLLAGKKKPDSKLE